MAALELVDSQERIRDPQKGTCYDQVPGVNAAGREYPGKEGFPAVDCLSGRSVETTIVCHVLRVRNVSHSAWRDRSQNERRVRYEKLVQTTAKIPRSSRSHYRVKRVHAELAISSGIQADHDQPPVMM